MNWKFNHIDFSVYPYYDKKPLGMFCNDDKATISIWAPTATKVLFRLYADGFHGEPFEVFEMHKGKKGEWLYQLEGNHHGTYYTIQCMIDGHWMDEIPDPYAFAVGVNGRRAMCCNFNHTNPPGWNTDQRVLPKHYTDMVLYELHVRDFSIDDFSGIKNKGKYLAFTEKNTLSPEGLKTGIGHLVEMGITHVHLLPVFDFLTVDEAHPQKKQYNWGYDPLNFNAPEGSYATDPFNGETRIREFKQMVMALHEAEIGVIMDVVYNHTALINHSYFNQTVPGYFYRQRYDGSFSDASGCGTEVATERAMVRKYIVDSLKFWANEYHIDGFRFDLMGVYDLDTMKQIRKELDVIDPRIVMYGEGWTAAPSPMDEKHRVVKDNAPKLDRTAMFNDDFRDAMKGHWGKPSSRGFASGQTLNEESVKYAIVGATHHPQIVYNYVASTKWAWSLSPGQSINYISCHDNYTFYDKLKLSKPDATLHELARMVCLAGAVLLTSQGVPFLHAGVEMLRTKRGNANSYKSPDEVNMIDWSRKAMFSYVTRYFQKLMVIRKKHPAFRMTSAEMVKKHLKFSEHYMPGVVAYELSKNANGDDWKHIFVIFNNNPDPVIYPVKKRIWKEIANGLAVDENGLSQHESHSVFVPPVSMLMLVAN
ncbi:MAG: type I pullulanase [Prolixibacteraceae bacterium]|nr:type I pullulanase [Prolixibacteraceae bacterium]